MATYISMLRGINVLGHNLIKMSDLQALCRDVGFSKVRTYIQSGNLIFEAPKSPADKISSRIVKAIHKAYGFSVSNFVITPKTLRQVIDNNPFLKKRGIDRSKLHVTFLSARPQETNLEKINDLPRGDEAFHCVGKAMYLYCPHGYGRTKLTNNTIERLLAVSGTTRNWRTVSKIYEMATADSS